MQKLETINGTLVFVEVPENCPQYEYREKESMPLCLMVGYYNGSVTRQILCHYPITLPNCQNGYEIFGEVAKEGITFDCSPFVSPLRFSDYEFGNEGLSESMEQSIIHDYETRKPFEFRSLMFSQGIELKEGFKFVVLKEK